MRSRTSFFNPTVFWNDLRHWWPLTAGYALLWCVILPLTRLTAYANTRISDWNMLRDSLDITARGGYFSALFTAILFAMAAFSYLTNPRATNGLHILPARRETLFVTHYLAGLCAQLAAQLLVVLLTALVLASRGASDARVTGLMLLTLALPTVFFYSFGVLCMVFTGQILAAPVFYGVLNVLVVGVELLVKTFAGNFLYGWAEPETATLMAFSPIVQLVEAGIRATGVEPAGRLAVNGLNWLWLYAAVGLVLAALALLVYRARHSEATGSIVAIGWARPIFRYGVASCAALALGQLLYYLFFGRYRMSGDFSLAGSLLCMAGAALLGFFAAEMLLRKSFRVWKTGWRGALIVTAALVALGAALSLDLTGYERYIPDPDAVESVTIELYTYNANGDCYFTATEADTIRLVEAAHQAVIRDRRVQQAGVLSFRVNADGETTSVGANFNITYHLKNGDFVRRRYSPLTLSRDALENPDSLESALNAIYNDPDVSLMRALGRWGYRQDGDPRSLPDLRFTGGLFSRPNWKNGVYLNDTDFDLSSVQAKQLYDAVLRDAAAGHASGSLFEDGQEYVSIQLYANYQGTYRGGATEPVFDEDGRMQVEFDLTITPRMTEALIALRGMGIDISFG